MHESALASAVISTISELKEKEGSRLKHVKVYVGELQNIDIDVFKEFIEMGLRDMNLQVSYEIIVEEALFKCRRCGEAWRLSDINVGDEVREYIHFLPEAVYAFIKCPSCSSSDFELTRGRGVRVSLVLGDES